MSHKQRDEHDNRHNKQHLHKRNEISKDKLVSFDKILKKVKPSFRNSSKNGSQKPKQEKEFPKQFEVFVGAIPFALSEKELKEVFAPCGLISGVKLLQTPDGKSKGRGYVKFANEESMKNAVQMNDMLLQGQRLKVDLVKEFDDLYKQKWEKKEDKKFVKIDESAKQKNKFEGTKSSTLVVRNLDQNVTAEIFGQEWNKQVGFKSSRVIVGNDGRNRGFGFVEFLDVESAEKALGLNGKLLLKKKMHIQFSAPKNVREEQGGNIQESIKKVVGEFKGETFDLV